MVLSKYLDSIFSFPICSLVHLFFITRLAAFAVIVVVHDEIEGLWWMTCSGVLEHDISDHPFLSLVGDVIARCNGVREILLKAVHIRDREPFRQQMNMRGTRTCAITSRWHPLFRL